MSPFINVQISAIEFLVFLLYFFRLDEIAIEKSLKVFSKLLILIQ